jgi:hypothetical protein
MIRSLYRYLNSWYQSFTMGAEGRLLRMRYVRSRYTIPAVLRLANLRPLTNIGLTRSHCGQRLQFLADSPLIQRPILETSDDTPSTVTGHCHSTAGSVEVARTVARSRAGFLHLFWQTLSKHAADAECHMPLATPIAASEDWNDRNICRSGIFLRDFFMKGVLESSRGRILSSSRTSDILYSTGSPIEYSLRRVNLSS